MCLSLENLGTVGIVHNIVVVAGLVVGKDHKVVLLVLVVVREFALLALQAFVVVLVELLRKELMVAFLLLRILGLLVVVEEGLLLLFVLGLMELELRQLVLFLQGLVGSFFFGPSFLFFAEEVKLSL